MKRIDKNSGIAIGPILFVLAILAVLAAALAAGSGSFTGSAAQETKRVSAAALIESALVLKHAVDKMAGNNAAVTDVVIDPDSTSNDNDLFSPSGGGVNAPSVIMANDPSSDVWCYPTAAVPRVGTSAVERLAMLKVSATLCDEINDRANAMSTPGAADIGDPASGALGADAANWPNLLEGKPTGCVNNSNADSPGYWFYQILGIQ